jgi:enterochelin esterase-like enzyme
MMTRLVFALIFIAHSALAQEFSRMVSALHSPKADSTWTALVTARKIPLVSGDSVAFLYRGEASTVRWLGDFNGMGQDKTFPNEGSKIPGTDIWILKASLPPDARLDYKIVLDDKNWILDPNNPFQQWTGLGGGMPNSELRMPEWKRDPIAVPDPASTKGSLKKDLIYSSKILGYDLSYSLYVHPFAANKPTPIVYVTDGYEYLHKEMGNMTIVLDNLISQKKIVPITVVFVDNREPAKPSNNRRMSEMSLNQDYLRFFTDELIPAIEKDRPVPAAQRGILGTSLGGLTAAYFAFSRPDIFGLAGIQSPAFWYKPEIYSICDQKDKRPMKTFITTGSINDTKEGAEKMKTILVKNACTFGYKEVAQGHSWGNWKDLIDDILIYFFAGK